MNYKTERWKTLRAKALKRDKYLCRGCAKYGRRVEGTTVHHIKEVADHPELAYTLSNLESLCQACHNKLHPEKGYGGKKRTGIPPSSSAVF